MSFYNLYGRLRCLWCLVIGVLVAPTLVACAGASEAVGKEPAAMSLVSLETLLAYESVGVDGAFSAFPFDTLSPPLPRPGDRVWVDCRTTARNHVYLVGWDLSWRFFKVASSGPGESDLRRIFPSGWILDPSQASMRFLTVVASAEPVLELETLGVLYCGAGKPGLFKTEGACGLLVTLPEAAPPAVQGMVKPQRAFLDIEGRRLPAAIARHAREGLVAVQFPFSRAL